MPPIFALAKIVQTEHKSKACFDFVELPPIFIPHTLLASIVRNMRCIKETQAIIAEKPCVIRKTLLYYKQKCLVFRQKHQALLNIVSTFGKKE